MKDEEEKRVREKRGKERKRRTLTSDGSKQGLAEEAHKESKL